MWFGGVEEICCWLVGVILFCGVEWIRRLVEYGDLILAWHELLKVLMATPEYVRTAKCRYA